MVWLNSAGLKKKIKDKLTAINDLRLARDLKIPTLMTSLATQLYRAAASAGYSEKDISAMANFFGAFVGINFSGSPTS
ncbi:MAG: hypothetical protein ACPL5I_07995 [Thermodesulfobacteriota bacterium]